MTSKFRIEMDVVAEATTHQITLTDEAGDVALLDLDGDPIPLSEVDSIEMTLIEVASGNIVNSRQKQDVLNANDCTMTELGLFTWNVTAADTSIVNTSTQVGGIERHLATFTIIWDSEAQQMNFEIELQVRNLRNVPQVAP